MGICQYIWLQPPPEDGDPLARGPRTVSTVENSIFAEQLNNKLGLFIDEWKVRKDVVAVFNWTQELQILTLFFPSTGSTKTNMIEL